MRKKLPSLFLQVPAFKSRRALVAAVIMMHVNIFSFDVYGQLQLLNDINTEAADNDKNAKLLTAADSRMYFIYNNALWRSNGSAEATIKLKTFVSISDLVTEGNTLYFSADDGVSGKELWRSNGTTATTVLVKDINPGSAGSHPEGIVNVDGMLYFSADDGMHGKELWTSRGYDRSTELVKDIQPGKRGSNPTQIKSLGGGLYFSANDGMNGFELWKSNGTSGGTTMLKDIRPGAYLGSTPADLTVSGDALYFSAWDGVSGRELWKSNGTPGGTMLLKDIYPGGYGSDLNNLTDVNGTLFFGATDGKHGTELWKSNGTAQGTVLVKDLNPGGQGSNLKGAYGGMAAFTNINGVLFFVASPGHHYLFRSDGTQEGTFAIQPAYNTGVVQTPQPAFTYMNGNVYFLNAGTTQDENYRNEFFLWRMPFDGTTPSAVKQLIPNDDYYGEPGYFREMIAFNNILYTFSRFKPDPDQGYGSLDFIRSNGTAGGTWIVKDMGESTRSSSPQNLFTLGDLVYFVGYPDYLPYGDSRSMMYRTDGTSEGTFPLKPSDPDDEMAAIGDRLFFTGFENYGWAFFVTEGRPETTLTLDGSIDGNEPRDLTELNGLIYYYDDYGFVKKTDGTLEGGIDTVASFDQVVGIDNVNGVAIVRAVSSDLEIWTISSSGETTFVKTIGPNPAHTGPPAYTFDTVIDGVLYFVADDGAHGHEIWQTDGTAAGTFMMFNLNTFDESGDSGHENDIRSFTVYNDKLFFSAIGPDSVWTFFKATSDHTYEKVADMPAVVHSVVHDGKMFLFPGTDERVFGTNEDRPLVQLWVSDGMAEGTQFLTHIEGRGLVDHAVVGDKLYFNTKYGPNLMRTDGTICGTAVVDVGPQNVYPMEALGDDLVFAGFTPATGSEPFIYRNINAIPDPGGCVESVASAADELSQILTPYPNPFTESFVIKMQGSNGEFAQVSVFTDSGTPVEKFNVPVNTKDFQIGAAWAKGFYVVKIETNSKLVTYRVVKE